MWNTKKTEHVTRANKENHGQKNGISHEDSKIILKYYGEHSFNYEQSEND